VVRVAPDEISYISVGSWKTIYGQRSVEMPKDPNFSLLTPSGVQSMPLFLPYPPNRKKKKNLPCSDPASSYVYLEYLADHVPSLY
jgi:hypothetical protein